MLRRIGILLFADFQLLDAAGPAAAFEVPRWEDGTTLYETVMLSADGGPVRSSCGARLHSLCIDTAPPLHTVLVCGGGGTREVAAEPGLISFIAAQAAARVRAGSVCTGAFLLAEAGVLNGHRATTHWRYAARLARSIRR